MKILITSELENTLPWGKMGTYVMDIFEIWFAQVLTTRLPIIPHKVGLSFICNSGTPHFIWIVNKRYSMSKNNLTVYFVLTPALMYNREHLP